MRYCPNEACPFRRKFGTACEYRDGFHTCAECGSALVDGAEWATAKGAPGPASAPEPRHPLPWSRVLVTALAPVVVAAVSAIPLPGINPDFLHSPLFPRSMGSSRLFTLGALGVTPFISAFAVVELAVALVPGWRPLRTGGPKGRARLAFPVAVVGTLFAVLQAFGMARWLAGMGSASAMGSFGAGPLAHPGTTTLLLMVLSLIATTSVLVLLCGFISRHGIGNGFSVVILCSSAVAALPGLESLRQAFLIHRIAPAGVFVSVGAVAALSGLTVFGVGEQGRRRLRTGPLRVPLSGIDPVLLAATLVGFAQRALVGNRVLAATATALGVVIATVAAALLFNQPSRVSDLLTRMGGPSARRAEAMSKVRDAFPRGVLASIVFCALVALAGYLAAFWGGWLVVAGSTVAILTACVHDLASEVRAWRRLGALVPVWPLHRVYAADAVVEALAAERVTAFLRGAALRSLSPFFSSFVPIEVMVPEADAQRSFALIAERLGPASAASAPAIGDAGTRAA